MRLADEIRINCLRCQRAGHIRRRHLDELYFVLADALLLQQPGDHKVLITVLARNREYLTAQITKTGDVQVFAYHHLRPVPMTKVQNTHRQTLFAQLHRQRRDHERGFQSTTLD